MKHVHVLVLLDLEQELKPDPKLVGYFAAIDLSLSQNENSKTLQSSENIVIFQPAPFQITSIVLSCLGRAES